MYRTRSIAKSEIDLTRPDAARPLVLSVRPWLVINSAAYTAVDRAESERNLAFAINADAPGAIAQACKQVGAVLVHLSTDYVFDGKTSTAYTETDQIRPINVYGESKAQGEAQVRAVNDQHIILRTSWLFARSGSNFVRTMLRLAMRDQEIAVVDDQFGTPTDAAQIAALIATMADRMAAPRLRPTTTDAYPSAAARPRFSLLDCSALARGWGLSVTPWTADFDRTVGFIMHDLKAAHS